MKKKFLAVSLALSVVFSNNVFAYDQTTTYSVSQIQNLTESELNLYHSFYFDALSYLYQLDSYQYILRTQEEYLIAVDNNGIQSKKDIQTLKTNSLSALCNLVDKFSFQVDDYINTYGNNNIYLSDLKDCSLRLKNLSNDIEDAYDMFINFEISGDADYDTNKINDYYTLMSSIYNQADYLFNKLYASQYEFRNNVI